MISKKLISLNEEYQRLISIRENWQNEINNCQMAMLTVQDEIDKVKSKIDELDKQEIIRSRLIEEGV